MNLRYLVDTDWAIHYLNGQDRIRKRLKELRPEGLALAAVSLAELYEGVWYSKDSEKSQAMLNNFLKGISLISIDENTCKLFGKERGRLRAQGKSIGDFDLLIGMTARQHSLTLLNNNRRHFELIEDLAIQSI